MREPRVLRPLEYGEVLNEAFDLYKRNFLLFMGIGAVVFIPFAFLEAMAPEQSAWEGLVRLASLVPSMAAGGAVAKAIADRYLGHEATIGGAWRFMRGRIWAYLLTSLLAGLLILGGFFLLIIPGFYLSLCFSLITGVMIVEEQYYRSGLKRCFALASGQHRRILNVVVLGGLICAIPGGFLQALVAGLAAAGTDLFSGVAGTVLVWGFTVLNGLVNAIVQPFMSVFSVLIYFDLRVRKEGFDIELLAQEMGEALPEGALATV